METEIDSLIRQTEEVKKRWRKPGPEDRKPRGKKEWQQIMDEREVSQRLTFKG